MRKDIRVPSLMSDTSHATIGRWLKKPGDLVAAEDVLLEIETDKVMLEVNSPNTGTLEEIMAEDGKLVEGGELLGRIDVDEAAPSLTSVGSPPPEEDVWTAEELKAVLELLLKQMGPGSLTKPDEHLSYVRTRIKSAVARHVV